MTVFKLDLFNKHDRSTLINQTTDFGLRALLAAPAIMVAVVVAHFIVKYW